MADGQVVPIPVNVISNAFGDRKGSLVIIDCSSGAASEFRPEAAEDRLPPCSTFKILNALIGIEAGIIASPAEPFYKWDGEERSIPTWNRDLTLREAFQASCVPAFQALARQIGTERMQSWIDRVGYGDLDLPHRTGTNDREGGLCEAPVLESVFCGAQSLMFIKKTGNGVLYGKTGSGTDDDGIFVLGWFVGYVESNGKTYAFACAAQGKNIMSKDARAIVEAVLKQQGML